MQRQGIVDTDIQSPGIHVLFGFEPESIGKSLNDYLWGECSIEDAVYDVTKNLAGVEDGGGKVYLIPSSMRMGEITRILKEGYEISMLNDSFTEVINALSLDYLFADTHPGLGEETLLSLAVSDISLIILRPDSQDYQGTSVALEVCRRLEVPNLFLVINKVLQTYDFEKVKRDVESVYKCEVAGVLPLSEDLVEMGSREVFLSQSSGAYLFSENRRNRKQDDHCLGSSILFGGRAVNDSTIALENQAEEYLLRLAKNQADISNTLFEKVESGC